jgi:hypothetical protein
MREFCEYGSVRGALRNERPYREPEKSMGSYWQLLLTVYGDLELPTRLFHS